MNDDVPCLLLFMAVKTTYCDYCVFLPCVGPVNCTLHLIYSLAQWHKWPLNQLSVVHILVVFLLSCLGFCVVLGCQNVLTTSWCVVLSVTTKWLVEKTGYFSSINAGKTISDNFLCETLNSIQLNWSTVHFVVLCWFQACYSWAGKTDGKSLHESAAVNAIRVVVIGANSSCILKWQ